MSRPSLIYALHSGNLYGTERMALATAAGLASDFDCCIMAPPGPALEEAGRMGFHAIPFHGATEFGARLWQRLEERCPVAFFATGVMHSGVCIALNMLRRRRMAHLHLVHGGAEERLSYGRKKKLNQRPLKFVAVSSYVEERLIANGVARRQIRVIENFLTDEQVSRAPRRSPFVTQGLKRLIVISRLDPEKRVDLLLEALERYPELRRFEVRVFGRGWDEMALKERASEGGFPVHFAGFSTNVADELASADLLVHLCPVEPFGLAILEAMAAGVPVLVPDSGGAGSLITDGVSGFHFQAGSSEDLARRLREIDQLPAFRLNQVVDESRSLLKSRFSETERVAEYRSLIQESLI